jgi:hypothetical protein
MPPTIPTLAGCGHGGCVLAKSSTLGIVSSAATNVASSRIRRAMSPMCFASMNLLATASQLRRTQFGTAVASRGLRKLALLQGRQRKNAPVRMAKTGRPGLSREKKAELWERWKSGQCASDIARALARTKGAIHHVLAFNGGIAPVARRRCPVALVLDEREEISRGIAAGRSIRRIAASLGRSPSTVSREVARHGGRSRYCMDSTPCRLSRATCAAMTMTFQGTAIRQLLQKY